MFVMLKEPNTALRWVVIGATMFLTAILMIPFTQHLFHFGPLHIWDVLISLSAGIACVLWFEVVKRTGVLQPAG